jgi:hypothetical protein
MQKDQQEKVEMDQQEKSKERGVGGEAQGSWKLRAEIE